MKMKLTCTCGLKFDTLALWREHYENDTSIERAIKHGIKNVVLDENEPTDVTVIQLYALEKDIEATFGRLLLLQERRIQLLKNFTPPAPVVIERKPWRGPVSMTCVKCNKQTRWHAPSGAARCYPKCVTKKIMPLDSISRAAWSILFEEEE